MGEGDICEHETAATMEHSAQYSPMTWIRNAICRRLVADTGYKVDRKTYVLVPFEYSGHRVEFGKCLYSAPG